MSTTTDQISPRWEWRTFGDGVGEAERRFTALAAATSQQGDEIYLLSAASDENVKIRNRLMDIKRLQQVNADGLEQWRPVMKAAFPLSAGDVGKVFEALAIPAPSLARAAYTLEQVIEELVTPSRRVRTVVVRKTRTQYRIDGCRAELAEVVVDGASSRTVAIESEDPARVIAIVRDMGLGRLQNTSYPRGLKRLVGMTA